MTEPINLILLMIVILEAGVFLAGAYSPDALEILGRRLRARAAAIRASREAYAEAYSLSHAEQANADAERHELRKMLRTERER